MPIDYTLSNIIILLIIGMGAGTLSGFFGIGGGTIIIPSLIILMHLNQHQAQAISLVVLLIPIALPAFLRYYKKEKKYIKIEYILLIILGSIIGGYCGAQIAVHLDGKMLKKIFALLLLYMGAKQFWKKKAIPYPKQNTPPRNFLIFILVGISTGICSGLMGIGGGIVLIPQLILLRFTQHQAQAISLGKLSIPIGVFSSFIVYKEAGHTDLHPIILWIVLGFIIASLLSAKIALTLSSDNLKKYFSFFIFCMGIYLLFF